MMLENQDIQGRSAERSAEGADGIVVPAIPVIAESERHGGVPYPLLDGISPTIGWQFRPTGKGGPGFVIIKRRLIGTFKVVEGFPLTEDGWARAWRSFMSLNPDDVPRVLATLQARRGAQLARHDEAISAVSAGDGEADLRRSLSKNLNLDFSTPGEGAGRKIGRVATNPYLILSAATVGLGIATVLTAGTVHLALAGVAAGQLTSNGSKAIDWWKSKRQGTVYLDQSAVEYLLEQPNEAQRLEIVECALSAMLPGEVHLTRRDLITAAAELQRNRPVTRMPALLGSPYMRGGLALLSAGLFLIAIVLIPEYIRDATLRAAAIISVASVILISISVVDTLKGLWMGPAVGE
jgi:hypothetical protein